MKIKNITLSASAMLLGASLLAPSVLAANPYDIETSGGELLGEDSVTIDPELVDSLKSLITVDGNAVITFSDSASWKHGWMLYYSEDIISGEIVAVEHCDPVRYLEYDWKNNIFDNDNGNVYYIVSNDEYSVKVRIDNIYGSEGIEGELREKIGVLFYDETIRFGGYLYSDNQCQDQLSLATYIEEPFIQMNLKLSKKNGEPFYSDELFLGVGSGGNLEPGYAANSLKILNGDNLLTKTTMYARSTEALQPIPGVGTLFVNSGNYIYNDMVPVVNPPFPGYETPFVPQITSDIRIKIGQNAQEQGVDVVQGLGFGWGMLYKIGEFYAREYTVSYASDENGEITGIVDEKVFSGNNPTGSVSAPKEGYKVEYWTADKNVILEDGTEVSAGEHLTTEQVKEVRVNSDLTFTAHHGEVPAPDPGPGPDPEPEPEPEPEPDPEPKPEPKPDPEVEPEEEPEIPVPNTSSPDTGAYTNDAGFITLGLAGSIVAGVTLALVGLAIKSKRN